MIDATTTLLEMAGKGYNMEIPEIILNRLGGNRFIAMTGAKNLLGGESDLSFKIGRNSKGITHVKIMLNPIAVYECEFYKVRGSSIKLLSHAAAVWNELQDVFTEHTGLDTRL